MSFAPEARGTKAQIQPSLNGPRPSTAGVHFEEERGGVGVGGVDVEVPQKLPWSPISALVAFFFYLMSWGLCESHVHLN